MSLLQMSFAGAAMILAIIIVRVFTINVFPKKLFLLLWELALLRLLVPVSIPSAFCAYTLLRSTPPAQNALADRLIPSAEAAPHIVQAHMPQTMQAPAANISVWFVIWLTGVILSAAFFSITYLRLRFEFQTSVPVENAFITAWLDTHQSAHPISVRQSDRIRAPLTYGIFHPVILMPKNTDWNNGTQLQYVLMHEYMHIRHHDLLRKLAILCALCIHWFNPAVYVMYFLFNRDIELACDAHVVHSLGNGSRADYARTLISLTEKQSGLMPGCNHFSENAIEERITAIMKMKKTTIRTLIMSATALIIIVVPFATSAQKHTAPDSDFDPQAWDTAAMIRGFSEDSLSLDIVEYVTDEDTERKQELIESLHLVEGNDLSDGNFLDGYYIYNQDQTLKSYKITGDTVYTFIDWSGDFTGSDYPEEYTTTDFAVFQQYLETYDGAQPGIPFFFVTENGTIKSIYEKFMP